ncbi:hypothetical protein EDB84DRAFT_1276612 [Lactarius hengduanensis]|nr:hypothetical protein EDB84DRAFT_1276612 [Lactarius hengduanensis]
MIATSIGYLYVCLLSPCTFVANIFFDEVLHPRFKTFYFSHHKWPQGWTDKALSLLQSVWTMNYKPEPIDEPDEPPRPVSAPVTTSSRLKKSKVDFDIVLNYGHQVGQGDTFEEYLSAPPLPKVMDPIGYWLKQWKAGEAIANVNTVAFAQMALDYLSVPGLFVI